MRNATRLSLYLLALVLASGLLCASASAAQPSLAAPSAAALILGEQTVSLPAYTIDGSNYFQLSDLAYLFRNTDAHFSVSWDAHEQILRLTTGAVNQHGPPQAPTVGHTRPYSVSSATVLLDGGATDFTGYTIDGANYFKLRDIMSALDISVVWDPERQAVRLDPAAPYEPDAPPPPGDVPLSMEQIAARAASAVLVIPYDKNGEQLGQGSGFFVRKNGWIATCYHVIDDPAVEKIEITTDDGTIYLAQTVLAYDPGTDLALLRVSGIANAEPLPLGDSSSLVRGQHVAVIASPFSMRNTVADGIISGFRDNLELRDPGRIDIQITTPVSGGSSGGAMFDFFGNVVGIIYAQHLFAENANFSIPVNDLKELFDAVNPIGLPAFRRQVAELAEAAAPEQDGQAAAPPAFPAAPFGVID